MSSFNPIERLRQFRQEQEPYLQMLEEDGVLRNAEWLSNWVVYALFGIVLAYSLLKIKRPDKSEVKKAEVEEDAKEEKKAAKKEKEEKKARSYRL